MRKLFSLLGLLLASAIAGADGKGPPDQAVRDEIEKNPQALGLTKQDVANAKTTNVGRGHNGKSEYVYMVQTLGNIEVANGRLNAIVRGQDKHVKKIKTSFAKNIAKCVKKRKPSISAEDAVRRAAAFLSFPLGPDDLPVVSPANGLERKTVFQGKNDVTMEDEIPVKLKFWKMPGDCDVRLTWELVVHPNNEEYLEMHMDAVTGEVLNTANWVSGASFSAYGQPREAPCKTCTMYGAGPYEPFDIDPLQIVVNPEESTASPNGWVDQTNSTQGNNVKAGADILNNNNAPTVQTTGSIGGQAVFDYTTADLLSTNPADFRNAAVVNLFYWNNIMHDILYQYGFDEVNGNFQENNFGRGGSGGDSVIADAQVRLIIVLFMVAGTLALTSSLFNVFQDGSGVNNANFATPPDGSNHPRMQMYLFQPFSEVSLGVTVRGAFYGAVKAGFGKSIELVDEPIVSGLLTTSS